MGKKGIVAIKFILSVGFLFAVFQYFLKIDNPKMVWYQITQASPLIYYVAIPVCLINWGLETRKWQILMQHLERLSFYKATKSTYSGVTVSNILPFRVGEYFGRIVYIHPEHRIAAVFNSMFGSIAQLSVSLFFGIPAIILLLGSQYHRIAIWAVICLILIVLTFSLLFFLSTKFKKTSIPWVNKITADIRSFNRKQVFYTIALSFLRYGLFSSFFVFLLFQFGCIHNLEHGYTAVAAIYFLQSFAPGMILTDIGFRTAIPLLLIPLGPDEQPALLAAALINYFFNLLLPSIIGLYFVLIARLKIK